MCEYCSIDNTEESLIGSDGVFYDEKEDKYYLYIQHFRNEIYKIDVTFCPKCGTELRQQ